jgi:ubiquinone biosynthesis protein UbiJ
MKIIAVKSNGDCLVKITQSDLQLITDTTGTFVEDQDIEVSGKLSVINQLSRKKDGIVAKLNDLSNLISNL